MTNQNILSPKALFRFLKAAKGIKCTIHVTNRDNDQSYLEKLRKCIDHAIHQFQPQFIIYNAGTDCMKNDPLGDLNISPEGIIKRDELMFELAY